MAGNQDDGTNPYENIAENDEYCPPKPTEFVSTSAVGCIVLIALGLLIGLVAITVLVTPPAANQGVILALFAGIVGVPIAFGWVAIWWLRNR